MRANILIAHAYKNGFVKIFLDFWTTEPLKNWQQGVSWSWEELGSGGQLRKAQGHRNKKACPWSLATANWEATASAPKPILTAMAKYVCESMRKAQRKRTERRILVTVQSIRSQLAALLSPSFFLPTAREVPPPHPGYTQELQLVCGKHIWILGRD